MIKAAPPTDPAMIGMTDPVFELLSAEFPVWIQYYINAIQIIGI